MPVQGSPEARKPVQTEVTRQYKIPTAELLSALNIAPGRKVVVAVAGDASGLVITVKRDD